jgi:tetratricopeptide (TPR) repeat protein
LLATHRPAEAAAAFKRALDLSRNIDGLFNAAQIDIIHPLLECYVALGRTQDADKEFQYGFRVAETAHGKNDLAYARGARSLCALARVQQSICDRARPTRAALQIVEQYATRQPLLGVTALRGLARTYLMEALMGTETEAKPEPMIRDPFGMFGSEQNRLNPEGERALKYALELLGNGQPIDHRTRAEGT